MYVIFGINTTCDISKLSQISLVKFQISLVVFMLNISPKHALPFQIKLKRCKQVARCLPVCVTYSVPLKKAEVGWTTLTSLEDCAAYWRSAMLLSTSGLSGVEKVSRVHSTGKSLDHHLSRGRSGQLSPRS